MFAPPFKQWLRNYRVQKTWLNKWHKYTLGRLHLVDLQLSTMEKCTSEATFKVCRSSRTLAAKDPEELDVSYRRKHSTPCYSLFLSMDCNRQTISSDVDICTADKFGLVDPSPCSAVSFESIGSGAGSIPATLARGGEGWKQWSSFQQFCSY